MQDTQSFRIDEQIGARYERVLVATPFAAESAADAVSGRVIPLQLARATAFDYGVGEISSPESHCDVTLALVDIGPHQSLVLTPAGRATGAESAFTVTEGDGVLVISDCARSVRVPATGYCDPPFAGPILGLRLGDGAWYGASQLTHVAWRGRIVTTIESIGPCFVQWRTQYRWGTDSHSFTVRWAASSDTLLVDEETPHDTDAAIEWLPLGSAVAKAYYRGGGEDTGPMRPLSYRPTAGATQQRGRRILNWLSHISYFNQWNLGWCGFASEGDDRFAGLFTGWSHAWSRRGYVRPEVVDDDDAGALIRLPIKRGRRVWGLVFTSREQSAIDSTTDRSVLNVRKTQLADLPIGKVSTWDLDPDLEPRELRLLDPAAFATFRERLSTDPSIVAAIDCYVDAALPTQHAVIAAAVWQNNDALIRQAAHALDGWATTVLASMAGGGYERIIIFDGRHAKRIAYDVDVLWHTGAIDETSYRLMRKALLALAYVFVDPDYCRYEDFWHAHDAPDEGLDLAMRDDIGDCPVPPNFASEFFTTTGVMAELCPGQRESSRWRELTTGLVDRFFERYFEADGTYLESINYHNHGFNELLCQLYAQQIHGVRDWLADPVVRGSLAHFTQVRLPEVSNALQPIDASCGKLAEPDRALRSPLPANGNSGGNGCEQEYGGQLTVGAWLYRDRDPELARALMAAWRQNGKPLLDLDHGMLTLVTLDPSIPSSTSDRKSVHRQSLGVVSHARRADGTPVWACFRAGKGTHHMDFDQGNIHLAAYDRVLLGEHGYHTHDNEGQHHGGTATWMHNAVVYSADRDNSSGYTGLEKAPEPRRVHLSDAFDYVAHTIVSDNFRRLNLSYRDMLPADRTVHTRHYLFVKPDYFVLWDTFEESHAPTQFWLHPHDPIAILGDGAFRAGEIGRPNLRIQFVLPVEPEVIENAQWGPLWSFAVTQPAGRPYLAVLHPRRGDEPLTATLAADGHTLRVASEAFTDSLTLPPAGSAELPLLRR